MSKEKFNEAKNGLVLSQKILDQYRRVDIRPDKTGLMNPLEMGNMNLRAIPPQESVLEQYGRMDMKPDRSGFENPLAMGEMEMKEEMAEPVLKEEEVMAPEREEKFFERLRNFFANLGKGENEKQ